MPLYLPIQKTFQLKSVGWAIYLQTHLGGDVGMNAAVLKNLTTQAIAFARDIANPDDKADTYFTFLRHKDVFDGHSWAEGYDYSGRMLTWVNQQSGGVSVLISSGTKPARTAPKNAAG